MLRVWWKRVKSFSQGFALIEGVVVIAVVAALLFSGIAAVFNSAKFLAQTKRERQAGFLLQEGAEIIRLWRDRDWTNLSNLTTGAPYYFSWTGGDWVVSSTPTPYEDSLFARKFTLASVNRDTNKDIVTSGGTLDPDTKFFTVEVAWRQNNATTTRTVKFYLAKLF